MDSRRDFNQFAAILLVCVVAVFGIVTGSALTLAFWARSDAALAQTFALAESNRATRNAETMMAWAANVSTKMVEASMTPPPTPALEGPNEEETENGSSSMQNPD